jgi:DNA repair protein RadA/Sms
MNNRIINIERAILSSVIFEPQNLEYITALKAKEFTLLEHQHVFAIMKKLYDEEKPVTEDFIIKNLGTEYELCMIDILAALPISNIEAYIEHLQSNYKKQFLQRKLTLLSNINDDTNIQHTISQLEHLIDEVNNFNSIKTNKDFTLADLVAQEFHEVEKVFTNITFLDDIFKGFELGHLISITGEQESGKTQLVNQILLNISEKNKSLYFSLEFNKRKLQKYMQEKTHYNLSNTYSITQDMTNGDIDEVCTLIKYHHKKNHVKIIAIDSQMFLDDESQKFNTSEEEITSIFRKLHKLCNTLDIIIFIIAQSSKVDHKNMNSIEIFGSKKASHLADIQLHLFNDKEDTKYRNLWIGKNKQNGTRETRRIVFNKRKLEFYEVMTDKKKIEITYSDEKTQKVIRDARSKFNFSN